MKKSNARQSEQAFKEKQRQIEKEVREREKNEEKVRQQLRKDIKSEMKKAQTDASQMVLDYFDVEEFSGVRNNLITPTILIHSQNDIKSLNEQDLKKELIEFFQNSMNVLPPTATVTEDLVDQSKSVSQSLEFVNTLYLYRNHLNLQLTPNINEILDHIENYSTNQTVIQQSDSDANNITSSNDSNAMEISEEIAVIIETKPEDQTVVQTENEEEEEWKEELSNAIPIKTTTNQVHSIQSKIDESELILDRIQLCLIKALRDPIHDLLDLNEKESTDKRGDKRGSQACKLPINQLTWMEIARMILMNYLYIELGKSKEDASGAIRGGRHPINRVNSKNIIRCIRYRMAVQFANENIISTTKTATVSSTVASTQVTSKTTMTNEDLLYINYSNNNENKNLLFKPLELQNEFNDEEEIIKGLSAIINNYDSNYSIAYQRCAKVYLKIFHSAQAKNLIWEIDRNMYPYYYSTIKYPITFVHIAYNLVNKCYNNLNENNIEENNNEEMNIANHFYYEMRQVLYNCITFNTESTYLFTQAQKLFHVLFRHTNRWVWNMNSNDSLALNLCDDNHCLWTGEVIGTNFKPIRCGKSITRLFIDLFILLFRLSYKLLSNIH